MIPEYFSLLVAGIFVVAFLYSSVGHAGASGYIAVMSLLSVAPAWIKPMALTLNILVSLIATYQFWRAGYFSWSLFWPFALASIPLAFVGGYFTLPTHIFQILVGSILIISAIRFLWKSTADYVAKTPPTYASILLGGGIGLLAGLTGTGGGIFLTPLLLFMHWAKVKTAAAVSAFFILFNSIAGLTGNIISTQDYPPFALILIGAAALGGSIGSYFGSRRYKPEVIKKILAIVLLIAGVKLIFF